MLRYTLHCWQRDPCCLCVQHQELQLLWLVHADAVQVEGGTGLLLLYILLWAEDVQSGESLVAVAVGFRAAPVCAAVHLCQ